MDAEQDNSAEQTRDRSMRVALLASARTGTEYTEFLRHLLLGLADESVPSALVCPPGLDVDSVISGTVEPIRHPAIQLPLMGHKNRKILTERLKEFKPTVLHCLSQDMAVLSRLLAKWLGVPYIVGVDTLNDRWSGFAISQKRCAKLICPTESIAKNLIKLHPKFSERIEHINPGTFVELQNHCFRDGAKVPCLICDGPKGKAEELENLIGVSKRLAIEGYEFLLVVVSSGRGERRLRKMLRDFGLSRMVVIVPRSEPWRAILAAGDIFIQPQPSNSFNPLILEAMGAAVAIVACKGGVDDLIIEDQTAAVFEPDSELSIYNTLKRLLDRHELAQQLVCGARARMKQYHSVSGMVDSILRTYTESQQWYITKE